MIPYPNLPCFLDESLYGYEEPDHPLSSFPSPPTQVGEKKTVVAPVMQPSRKADRHSKICTAQGLRHRRMRLSVKIATKFFALQDRLGFDKASQTIEWLLTNAHSAIEQLTASNSAKKETMHSGHHSAGSDQITTSDNKKSISLTPPRKRRNISRKGTVDPIVMKDWREKARARARERTREKKKKKMMTMMMMMMMISNRINGG